MAIAATPRITPEAFLRLPDEGLGFELVDGELRERNESKKSSRTAGRVYTRLDIYCDATQAGWVFPEGTSYRCFPEKPDQVRRADVSFIGLDRMTAEEYEEDGYTLIAPDLAVEVVSPTDSARDVEEKNEEWLAAGVRHLWVIYPDNGLVRVHRPDGTETKLRVGDTLTAEDLLPGFACPVAELFRKPGETVSSV